jgi:hypothetical protein
MNDPLRTDDDDAVEAARTGPSGSISSACVIAAIALRP